MKLKYKSILYALSGTLLLLGCTSTFDDLNTNPDTTTKVSSSMLATKTILDMTKSASNWKNEFLVKRMCWGEQMDDSQYNRFGKGSFGGLEVLTNAQKMVELSSEDDLNAYTGLYYLLKGWYFFRTTMNMGDIPYSEALNIDTYRYPKYDEQKDVFKGILADLALADEYFAKATRAFSGDPFYLGEPSKWRKAANVLRLKVLISLSKRADDTPDLQIKELFAKIISENNLFESNEDNLQVVYSDKEGQKNPYHVTETRSIEYYAATNTLIEPLKKFKDNRMFYYLAPAEAFTNELYLPAGETLKKSSDWDAYQGVDVAGVYDTEKDKIAKRLHSRPNDVYRYNYVGVPCIRLGYADMNFIIAEAAERGWIHQSAQEFYEKGIRASFQFVRSTVPAEYNNGVEITDQYIDSYLKGEYVSYKTVGSSADRLKQIWIQAYIARYFHMATDDYYEYRRNKYPEFPINPETNLNDAKDKIPMRYMYPESETNYNKEQLYEALERQWGGVDDVNEIMWILK